MLTKHSRTINYKHENTPHTHIFVHVIGNLSIKNNFSSFMAIHLCFNTCVNIHSKVLECHSHIFTLARCFSHNEREGKRERIVNWYSHSMCVCISYLISWERKKEREKETHIYINEEQKRVNNSFARWTKINDGVYSSKHVFDHRSSVDFIDDCCNAITLLVVIRDTASWPMESSINFFVMVTCWTTTWNGGR